MHLSLCVTTYNRYEMTIESFAQVLNDDRIDDIVIFDDCSTDGSAEKLTEYFGWSEKISIGRHPKNVGMSMNKAAAITAAKNDWCILFDSDNIIGPDYLDAFYEYVAKSEVELEFIGSGAIYCPDFAKPTFDYTKYSHPTHPSLGIFEAKDAAEYIADDCFNLLMNTCNYIVNRDFYSSTYKYNKAHKASDTIWHNYNHLKAGGSFHVVPGMQYMHRVHAGSGFMQDAQYNIQQANEVRKLIQQL